MSVELWMRQSAGMAGGGAKTADVTDQRTPPPRVVQVTKRPCQERSRQLSRSLLPMRAQT